MGFISFNLKYYEKELTGLETDSVTEQTVYRAKQLLKALDDLRAEGYTALNDKLEEAFSGVSRLKSYLAHNHAEPFHAFRKSFSESDIAYDQRSFELTEAIEELIADAEKSTTVRDDAFLSKSVEFCKWMGYEENTAYVFLLRDTLAPYVFYRSKGKKSVYPWLLGRKTLAALTGTNNADDEIRSCIFKALEFGKCADHRDFRDAVLPDMRSVLKKYPETEKRLRELLGELKEDRIVAVESGCSGTFPMLLMSLDRRVDMRMYTAYPYLSEMYGDKIYTHKYEEMRLFETLYSQDLYFRFSDLRNGRFFVNKCAEKAIEKTAVAEIKTVLQLSKSNSL